MIRIPRPDLARLLRIEMELPVLRHVRSRISVSLPSLGYCVCGDEKEQRAWSMAGGLLENYVLNNFRNMGEVYTYISETGYKLAMDIIEATPNAHQFDPQPMPKPFNQ